jgi:hypothetical protein
MHSAVPEIIESSGKLKVLVQKFLALTTDWAAAGLRDARQTAAEITSFSTSAAAPQALRRFRR